jgi:hypothetical protein
MPGVHTVIFLRHDHYIELSRWRGDWHYRRSIPYDAIVIQ